MGADVVVLGSGYAGTGAIKSIEAARDGDVDLTWVSDVDHHLVLHESHRCIRDPGVRENVVIPVEEIHDRETSFRRGTVVGIDADERTVHLEDGTIPYDYLLVCLGTRTAFFGIEGLSEHAHTIENIEDVLGIHEDIVAHARDTTGGESIQVVVGGAGLSGIQTAGEVAALREDRGFDLDITLVEGLDEILPDGNPGLQTALRRRLEARDITIRTGEFVGKVDEDTVYVGETGEIPYDVLVWTGGITGREALANANVDKDGRSNRLYAGQDFRTENERVFAIGDCALVDQPGDSRAPPTAQAAWQAAAVAGRNVVRAVRGQPLQRWRFDDKGTVVSVGEDAVAHDVSVVPFVDTFGGFAAETLKKAIAARWIRDVAGTGRALRAWPDM